MFNKKLNKSVKITRLFIKKRRSWILYIILLSFFTIIFINRYQSNRKTIRSKPIEKSSSFSSHSLPFTDVKLLLDQLFDPLRSLIDIQLIWNKLLKTWHEVLIKFVHDACELCHENHSDCYDSIDLSRYIYHINESFYPSDEIKRPSGMGIYYYFDLKTLHSLNNSILSSDVSYCDYFHMIQLMINVQLILHQSQIKYFVTKGTLIGVLRHHDVIPWDSDIDLFIPKTAANKLLTSFRQIDLSLNQASRTTDSIRSAKDRRSYQDDLVVYRFLNIYNITSYKIFSLRSPIVNQTNYRWPKIDIFPYDENSTHIYAYPKKQHNLGTMSYISKTDIEPLYLRLLGPLLVPSPNHLQNSLKSMVKLGQSNVFHVCEGNTFLHRYNEKSLYTWRLPCTELHKTYPFVKSRYNSTTNLCYEELIYYQQNQTLSLYIYKCHEWSQRTL